MIAMKRRTFLSGIAAAHLANPVFAQTKRLSLADLSTYLNSLVSAEGAFTQVNADGTLSKGVFYLMRPGRMRFEYAAPDDSLVIAGQGKLAIFDNRSNTGPQQYPLNKTPLSIILKDTVNLNASGMIVAHENDGTATSITAQDPEHPNYGTVQLVFTDKPTELRQWIVTDETGQKTTVILGKLDKKKQLNPNLFDISGIIKKTAPTR
jgi:outer membrane lipoprotein-sorting protein